MKPLVWVFCKAPYIEVSLSPFLGALQGSCFWGFAKLVAWVLQDTLTWRLHEVSCLGASWSLFLWGFVKPLDRVLHEVISSIGASQRPLLRDFTNPLSWALQKTHYFIALQSPLLRRLTNPLDSVIHNFPLPWGLHQVPWLDALQSFLYRGFVKPLTWAFCKVCRCFTNPLL